MKAHGRKNWELVCGINRDLKRISLFLFPHEFAHDLVPILALLKRPPFGSRFSLLIEEFNLGSCFWHPSITYFKLKKHRHTESSMSQPHPTDSAIYPKFGGVFHPFIQFFLRRWNPTCYGFFFRLYPEFSQGLQGLYPPIWADMVMSQPAGRPGEQTVKVEAQVSFKLSTQSLRFPKIDLATVSLDDKPPLFPG